LWGDCIRKGGFYPWQSGWEGGQNASMTYLLRKEVKIRITVDDTDRYLIVEIAKRMECGES